MKLKVLSISMLTVLSLSIGGMILASSYNNKVSEAEAYSARSVPTTIDLNATSDEAIRDYYSDLVDLLGSQKYGTNLLKNLKPILKNGQKYFSYGSSATTAVWQAYEIVDRDWVKSPANEIPGYNSETNIISGYTYGTGNSNVGSNPYIHALYVNRNAVNNTRAWGDHSQTNYGFNQEHIWAKSCGFEDNNYAAGARGDLMHLWAGNGRVNGQYHSNYYYGYVDTNRTYTNAGNDYSYLNGNLKGYSQTLGGNVTVFEPQDSDKGDIARAIFYMAARYNYLSGSDSDGINSGNPNLEIVDNVTSWSNSGYTCTTSTTGKMGILSDLLEWNRLDPPDEWEIHRNDLLYTNFTNNRNPFIDFPDWADYIWGDKVGTPVNPETNTIHAFSGSGEQETVNVTSVSLQETATIKVGETLTLSPSISPHDATNKNVSWISDDESKVTVLNGQISGVAVGNARITVTTQDGNKTATCTVTVVEASVIDTTSDTLTTANTRKDTSYDDWDSVVGSSGAVYAGQSMKSSNNEIQIRTTNNNSGIVSTSSPGNIKKVSVTWGQTSNSGKKLDVYGSNSAYTAATDLYNQLTQGTKLGTISFDSGSTYLTIDSDYEYVGVKSNNGTIYLDSITFDWEIPVSSVSLESDSIELDLYGVSEATLTATVLPENATNKNISWSSSDEEVATVSDGVITAVTEGEATINVTTEDGSKTATCLVTVIDSTPAPTTDVTVEASILELAVAGNWVNETGYGRGENNAIALDENISFYTRDSGNNGKYYSNGNNWRLYSANDGFVTIKAENDCTISSVTLSFTVYKDGVLKDESSETVVSGEPNSVNASSATFTVTAGQVRITSISVTYEENAPSTKKLSSIEITNAKTEFVVGGEFVKPTVTAHFDDDSSQNVTGSASFTGYNMSQLGNQTVTVSYTYNEATKSATYQISIQERAASPYVNGVGYKLFYHSVSLTNDYYFAGSMSGDYGAASSNYSDGVYVYFEQNGDGQNLYFFDANNNNAKSYIIVTVDTKPHFRYTTTAPNNESNKWYYSDDDECLVYVIGNKNYSIGSFNNYTTFSAFDVEAYPDDYKPQFSETAESFSYSVLNKITCDPTGVTSPIYHSGYSWSDLSAIYNTLDSSEQDLLKNSDADQYSEDIIEQAMAKYEYIVGKYSLENFIAERTPRSFPHKYFYIESEENHAMLVVVVLISLATLSISLAFIIKKRKK